MSKSEIRPLTREQEFILKKLYYEDKFMFGRDKLFDNLKKMPNHPTQKQINQWLKNQKIHQLFRGQKRSSILKPIVAKKPNTIYQIDLVDMGNKAFDDYRYILTLVDVFTRQAFAKPIKNKDSTTVVNAFNELYGKVKKKNKNITQLQSDNGSEFINPEFKKTLKDKKIRHFTSVPGKPQSNGVIERFNGTLKRLMNKDLYSRNSKDWVHHIDEYIDAYNDSYHVTLKMSPNEANDNPKKAYENVSKSAINRTGRKEKPDIGIGNIVRLKKHKGKLDKDSDINWSKQTYVVERVIMPKKPSESIKYYVHGKKNAYSRNDLQLVDQILDPPSELVEIPEDEYLVDKITEKKIVRGKVYYKTFWKGYPESEFTWEPFENIKDTEAYDLFLMSN